ncbi:MAG: TatD family hydrolase [Gammaproteobacteria bacterium]|nr:MAG: TatD family hydrolase [Gammaproteobacteria bacterium]TND06868.1 MAG: TatD family hydrolase [Gammaproteobacteria bacterium]
MSFALVDTHCHLDMLDLDAIGGDLDSVIRNAKENGVTRFLTVSISLENIPAVIAIARRYETVYASAGVHPNERNGREPDVDDLIKFGDDSNVIAIGETGLDYYRSTGDLEWQRERFRRHIFAAKYLSKPLIVHSRDAREDTLRILAEENAAQAGGVMHCYVEDLATAQRCIEMNFYISFSGIVTFKNTIQLQQVAREIPLGRMLLETDSPYLAPVPFRGKTNQPAYIRHVAARIAELRGISVEEVAEVTTQNFVDAFGVAA